MSDQDPVVVFGLSVVGGTSCNFEIETGVVLVRNEEWSRLRELLVGSRATTLSVPLFREGAGGAGR